jgi:transcriptional regulator with XRE-family HTH domain
MNGGCAPGLRESDVAATETVERPRSTYFGRLLRYYRQVAEPGADLAVTQKSFATALGYHNTQISHWEQGISLPSSASAIHQIADVLRLRHSQEENLLCAYICDSVLTALNEYNGGKQPISVLEQQEMIRLMKSVDHGTATRPVLALIADRLSAMVRDAPGR